MSLIKPVQPVRQQPRGRGVHDADAEADQKLSRREIAIVASSGLGTIGMLTLVAWLLLPISGHIVPFVAISAWPALTLLAIIYQAVVYRRQWNAMQASLRQTKTVIGKMQEQLRASERQAIAMEKSLVHTENLVKQTEQSIKATERSTRHAQRAYITVTKRQAIKTGFWLTIENSGNTPALEVSVWYAADANFTAPVMPSPLDMERYVSVGVLAPREPYTFFIANGRSIRPDEVEYFDDPQWDYNWWCIGVIYYRDIFQSGLRDFRETGFSFYHDRKRNLIQAGSPTENYVKEQYTDDQNQ